VALEKGLAEALGQFPEGVYRADEIAEPGLVSSFDESHRITWTSIERETDDKLSEKSIKLVHTQRSASPYHFELVNSCPISLVPGTPNLALRPSW